MRRHLLVRSLPQRMLDKLLYQRKYMFSAHKLATWLSYLGLVQFSPQTLKEKDQVSWKIDLLKIIRSRDCSIPKLDCEVLELQFFLRLET